MNTLDTALAYTRLGIRVVPIKPGHKYPGIDNWQNLATDDSDVVTSWWSGDYKSYGIGIATGRTKHGQIFVVDVDDRDEYRGSDTLHDLEQRYGALPETVTAITGTGGQHLYFYSPVEVRNDAGSRLGVGLDIRGEGGQVLAAPTTHPNGRQYQWVDGWSPMEKRPANAPQWLLTLLTTQPAMIKPQGTTDLFLADPTTPSARYCAQTTWEQLLIPDGWTLAKTDRHGEQHWTRPGKDTRDGISATIGHNGNDALIVFTSTIPWLPEGGYNRFGYMAARDHNGDWKQAAKQYLAHNTTPADTTIITPDEMLDMLVDWKTFWTQEHIVEDWIAKPLIARARQTALFAGAKTGKSWLTLNVVAALATGKPILGHPPQTQVHCLYLDYEMVEADLYERLEQFGYTEDDDLSHLHYALIPSLPPLNTAEGASAMMRLCELTKAEVVVIDTTGRAIEGEENSADSYREFARTTGLALKRAGIACVRTDHAGKDGGKKHGQRGSSAKNDDVDIVYRLDKTDDGLMLVRTHTRISWVPDKVDLIVEDIDDITTIRQRTRTTKGWTTQEIDLAKHLDTLGIPKNAGVNETQRIAKELGAKLGRKSVLSRAIQCRQLPSPDPLETGTTLGNHPLDPMVALGTTHRTDRYGVVPARSEPNQTIDNFNLDDHF
ncbi:Prim_Pol domain containing protein [uncultured Caudovirales phage]|uniref:Prim_Pol domain containing protein n=1 Tax=uncultured Caudovirales phage TaxID=2100421 RepID=A0A6J5PVL0_9CAUD|nr:Prim_Pol domain containing protein [uncultured Caudovirales phage]CAB4184322.1 Prim_Pol domain containing protein [uncultured Caudovirales phage]CAB4203243.1 Prim_Pol domain containing protein [uncultured Caudovirales phage]